MKRELLTAAACLVLGAGGVLYVSTLRSRAIERAQIAEREAIRQAGLVVAGEATRADLRRQVDALEDSDATLRSELERVRAAAPRGRVVRVTQIESAPVVAEGAPVVTVPCLEAGEPVRVPCPEPEVGCSVVVADYATRAGLIVPVGSIAARWRWPGADWRAHSEPIDERNTRSTVEEMPPLRPLGWGFGGGAAWGPDGLTPAIAISPPRWRVGRLHGEAVGTLAAGHGHWSAQALLLARW